MARSARSPILTNWDLLAAAECCLSCHCMRAIWLGVGGASDALQEGRANEEFNVELLLGCRAPPPPPRLATQT